MPSDSQTDTPTRAQLQAAIENLSQGLCMFDAEANLLVCNSRYAEIYGLPTGSVQPGISLREIVDHRYAMGSLPNMSRAEYLEWRDTVALSPVSSETTVELGNSRVIAIRHHPMPCGAWVSTHDDITERRRAEARIVYMARHDGLTDLPNRVVFKERLEQAVLQSQRGRAFAVFCLDLDGFKSINDSFGHAIGDRLLIAVAQRLRDCVREADTVARLGGDEFAVVFESYTGPREATLTCERIIDAISAPFDIEGIGISVGISIGIAISPEDGSDSDTLLRNADLALYLAKSEGRGTFRFFEPEMDARVQLRRSLESDLRQAATNGEFRVHYQPLVNLRSRQVTSFEALLRWEHPTKGMIPPSDFIPIAEELGLIVAIGNWVLHRACMDASAWPEDVRVSVNISPNQFHGTNLIQSVKAALAASGLAPDRLALEITETVLLKNDRRTLDTLNTLRGFGVSIALDDFGTAYSSLSYLHSFPFDKIKIDQSFVRDLLDKRQLSCIVRAVASLGASLGIATTAEGVETTAQMERLVEEGCTEAQGFLFGSAQPAHEIGGILERINGILRVDEMA